VNQESTDRREIEAKYLVRGDAWRGQGVAREIVQGFLSRDPERVVRVRVIDGAGYLTVKGASQELEREEYEFSIPPADAHALLRLCLPYPVHKIRHEIRHAGVLWEVDEFLDANVGLILAELELAPDQSAARAQERKRAIEATCPSWVGEEVSGESRYYNAVLSSRPFGEWSREEREDMEIHARGDLTGP
jgi:CYTH domain-containing protein